MSNLLPDDVVYLAGRYTRREELCGYANHLRALGLRVEARWLLGTHQVHGEEAARAVEEHIKIPLREGRLFASDDVEDVMKANVLIAFTETPESAGSSRGGRHVEWGIGLARRGVGDRDARVPDRRRSRRERLSLTGRRGLPGLERPPRRCG